jgi:hypothetical protein
MIGLPQGAQALGFLLLVVFVSSTVRGLRRLEVNSTSILLAMVLMLHPASLRVFTEASADAYALFVILAIALLFIRHWGFDSADVALLGFVSWIGLQSRYQLAAVAVASTVSLVFSYRGVSSRYGAALAFIGGSAGALVLASPFYVMNEISFGNPVWPLLIDRYDAAATYNDIVASEYARSLTGRFVPGEIAHSVATLVTTSFLFPLAILIVVIIALAARVQHTGARLLGLFGAIFFLEWFLMQPLLYPRFILLMLPVAVVSLALLLQRLLELRPTFSRPARIAALLSTFALAAFAPYVNRDSVRYAVTGDESEFHRYTWFHGVYEWVNDNTPRNARFLVIVSSGQSYYLDRAYRRADPWISAAVDWPRTDTGVKLDSVLALGRYSYVIYENRDWKDYPGGNSMMTAISDARRKGLLREVRSFDENLYTSRFRRTYRRARVLLLERAPRKF